MLPDIVEDMPFFPPGATFDFYQLHTHTLHTHTLTPTTFSPAIPGTPYLSFQKTKPNHFPQPFPLAQLHPGFLIPILAKHPACVASKPRLCFFNQVQLDVTTIQPKVISSLLMIPCGQMQTVSFFFSSLTSQPTPQSLLRQELLLAASISHCSPLPGCCSLSFQDPPSAPNL